MKQLIVYLALALATLIVGGVIASAQEKGKGNEQISKQEEQSNVSYSCPMHPEVVSDKPGKCPKCGMNLEKNTSVKPGNEEQVVYYCPMHPEVVSSKPGKCPKCRMNVEKKKFTDSKAKSEMKMDSMCAEMCMMMMNDPAMMKMMHECMMGGMGDMKDMKERPDDAMRMKSMEKMKSCCGMMKNK